MANLNPSGGPEVIGSRRCKCPYCGDELRIRIFKGSKNYAKGRCKGCGASTEWPFAFSYAKAQLKDLPSEMDTLIDPPMKLAKEAQSPEQPKKTSVEIPKTKPVEIVKTRSLP